MELNYDSRPHLDNCGLHLALRIKAVKVLRWRSSQHGNPAWDAAEAEALYERLEREVIPEFYTRNDKGIPTAWVARMRESMPALVFIVFGVRKISFKPSFKVNPCTWILTSLLLCLCRIGLGNVANVVMVISVGREDAAGIYGTRLRLDPKLFVFEV